jgi:hypothetical protein
MAAKTIEHYKQQILAKLRNSGPAGLTKSKLGISGSKSRAGLALKELEKTRKIANLGNKNKTRFVLIEHFKPLEMACDQVEANALKAAASKANALDLMMNKDLIKGCEGEVRKKFDEAIDWLVKQQNIIRLRRGSNFYYVHPQRISALLPDKIHEGADPKKSAYQETPDVDPSSHFARTDALEAYERVRQRIGYSNIPIYNLQQELEAPMSDVKSFILAESRRGNAVLSVGDWSLSSEEVRSGVIEIGGYRYLLVRFLS